MRARESGTYAPLMLIGPGGTWAPRVRELVDKRCTKDGRLAGVELVAFTMSTSPLRLAIPEAVFESWGT